MKKIINIKYIQYIFNKFKNIEEQFKNLKENQKIEEKYFGNQLKDVFEDIKKNKIYLSKLDYIENENEVVKQEKKRKKDEFFHNLDNKIYKKFESLKIIKNNEYENFKEVSKQKICHNEYIKLLNITVDNFISRINELKQYLNENIDNVKDDEKINKTFLKEIKMFLPHLSKDFKQDIENFYNSNYVLYGKKEKEFLLDEIKYNRYNDFAKNKTHEIRIKNLNNVEFINNSTEKLLNDLKKDTIEIIKEKEKIILTNVKQSKEINNIQSKIININTIFDDSFYKINDKLKDFIIKNIDKIEKV